VATSSNATSILALTVATTKTTAAWSAGAGGGSWDGGGVGPAVTSGWYHVFLIKRLDTGAVDVCVSPNPAAPTFGANIPSAYTLYRRIGALKTNGSFQWVKFLQMGDQFWWDAPAADATTVNLGTTSALATVSVPSGVQVLADIQALAVATAAGGAVLVTSPSVAVSVLGAPSGNTTAYAPVANLQGVGYARVLTNTSSQVRVVGNAAATNQYSLATMGWRDFRGTGN
jgi:hypothetical protein